MTSPLFPRKVFTRLSRMGEAAPPEETWLEATQEERMDAVLGLTRLCMAWNGEPPVDQDLAHGFRAMLAALNENGVAYLVVGAHALAVHGHVRATKDLDIWVRPEAANAARLLKALGAFGAPLHDLSKAELSTPGIVFQVGVPPVRIDIVTSIDGVGFDAAWEARVQSRFVDQPVAVLSRAHLIANKRAAGRL